MASTLTTLAAALAITAAVDAHVPVEVDVRPLSGPVVSGELAAISGTELVLETPEGPRSFALRELLSVRQSGAQVAASLSAKVTIQLVDGSRILASGYSTEKGKAVVEFLDGARLELPTAAVRTVRLKPAGEEFDGPWHEIADEPHKGDAIVIRKTALDYLEGVLLGVTADTVQFEFDGSRFDVAREKVEGLIYYHPSGSELPTPLCRLVDVHGSSWNVQELALIDGALELTTTAGASHSIPVADLHSLDFAAGNVSYLSDREPESVNWMPFIESPSARASLARLYQPRRDTNFAGAPLVLGGESYEKGLALHSRTEIVYRLPPGFRRLQMVAGIDDAVRDGGNVRLTITGDGKPLLDEALSGTDKPMPIDLDVSGVRRLTILVDFGLDLDVADHLLLCDARIVK